jgi:DNA-binding XRE family transcriptional regulator
MNPETYKKTRESLGTQAEVARMLETARETIARRETGKDRITREAALAIEALSKRPKNQRMPDTEGS